MRENQLKASLVAVAALVPMLFLGGLTASWILTQDRTDPQAPPPETTSPTTTVATPLPPREDVPGEDLDGLPRYPDSVRTGYERSEGDGLILADARYLVVGEKPDTVRGFYRGVFRSEGWTEGDADFSEGVWTFFVTHDEREATVEIEPQDADVVEVDVRLSEPRPEPQPEPRPIERAAPEPPPLAPEPIPATPPQAQYAPPPASQYTPQTPYSSAPAYGGDDDGYDDDDDGGYDDDGGEDD